VQRSPRSPRHRYARQAIDSPELFQFVVLSMLLHVLAIVVFGVAPGAGPRRGDNWWGALDVTLRRLAPEARMPLRAEPGPEQEERRPPAPRRAQVGKPEGAPEATPPAQPPPQPAQEPPQIDIETPREAERLVIPTTVPVEPIAPRPAEREIAPPIMLPPREVPVAPAAPIESLAPPATERAIAPPVMMPPRESIELPNAPVERIAPQPAESQIAPPVLLPPREIPAVPQAPIERIAPRGAERELAPAAPALRAPPAAVPAAPRSPTPAATSPTGVPSAPSSPQEELPRLRFGPTPEEEIFKGRPEVVTPPAEPGDTPHIDRQAARDRAREIASGRSGTRGVINLPVPVPPETKSKEAKAIEKAGRTDCRTAYAGMLLLAVPFLLADTVTDTGCKW
jgi:hypothetical protein